MIMPVIATYFGENDKKKGNFFFTDNHNFFLFLLVNIFKVYYKY